MTGRKYTLTLELYADTLQYLSKFLELLDTPGAYVNGETAIKQIKDQLNSLKSSEYLTTEPSPTFSMGYDSRP